MGIQPCGEGAASARFDWLPQSVKHHERFLDLPTVINRLTKKRNQACSLCMQLCSTKFVVGARHAEGCTTAHVVQCRGTGIHYTYKSPCTAKSHTDCGWFLGCHCSPHVPLASFCLVPGFQTLPIINIWTNGYTSYLTPRDSTNRKRAPSFPMISDTRVV